MTGLDDDDRTLRDVVANLHEGFQLLDADLRYVYLNDAAIVHARRSRDELIGRKMSEVYPGVESTPMYAVLRRVIATGEPARLENEFEYGDGRRGSFELSVQPSAGGVVVLSTDVTARNDLQAQLRQAQKLDVVGRLAGGVAHDFNNMLTIIGSLAYFAENELPRGSEGAGLLREVQRTVRRAADVTRKLLAISRQQTGRPVVVDLNAVVREAHGMFERVMREDVRVALRPAASIWAVRVDPVGLEQVLLNLVVNARDAMRDGGIITLETKNVVVEAPLPADRSGALSPGEYVVVSVTDTGTGIAAQHLGRIFEPFYTTKGPAEGTGLGLSVCAGIVEDAGGHITVYSEVGEGTTFRVYFPRALAGTVGAAPAALPPPRGGDESIAVVEDDPQIRELMLRALRGAGYTLVDADAPGRLNLVVTDVVMPRVKGPAVVAKLRALRPDLRALYVSGYPGGAVIERELLAAGDPLLEKPFTPDALLRAVRGVLDA